MQPAPTEIAVTNHRLIRSLKLAPFVTSVIVTLIGGLALAGWAFGIERLKSVAPGFVTMKPNTALCFVLTGVSLWLWRASPQPGFKRGAAQLCGGIVAGAGLLTLSQYLFGWNPGIDELLFRDLPLSPFTSHPGRMSVNTAGCFALSGCALVWLRAGSRRRNKTAEWLAVISGFIALTTLIGYMYSAHDFIGFFGSTHMAPHTAIALLALNVGLLAAQDIDGIMTSFVSSGPEGILARRLAFGGMTLMLALGLLTQLGEQAGYISMQSKEAMLMTASIALFTLLVWRVVRAIERLDAARFQSEARYAYIFQTAGVSIWEEDFSLVKAAFDELRAQGVSDFRRYFADHPEFVQRAVEMVKVVDVNDETVRMFGAQDKDELLSSLSLTFVPETLAVFTNNLLALAEGHRSFASETEFQTLRGGRLNAIITVSYPPPDVNITRALVSIMDITERNRAEAERERLYEQERAARAEAERMRAVAEAANRSKDEFLAIVSHELRSPLNAVLGYTRLLRSAPADKDAVARAAAVIERNARTQLQIVEDLLDSARIISGKLRIETRPTDLVSVLEGVLDVIRPAAESKGVELVAHFRPQPEQTMGDANRLQQIVWNLLSNAVKFTPAGGCVELRMESDAERIRITISDNGKGIEPEFLPHVFDRFWQADTSVTRRFRGLGLGLSLVKQLVELHGGTIEAASEGVGRGAAFTITLPRLALQPALFAQPRALATSEVRTENAIPLDDAPSLAGVRALVVDDQEDARALLTAALNECGAQVMAVSSGLEALAILSDPPDGLRPHVLILDIAMPGEDGYAVLQKVRALEAERGVAHSERIPAIALTAFGRSEDRLRALAAGFSMHVAKPVEPAELAIVIASLTNGHRTKLGASD